MKDTENLVKPPKTIPCRLYAILAREAPIGVIFRRGPSKWVQIIHWNTATNTFTPGQWFHGRVYERCCDLSPDGSLLIYFAQKINRRTMEDKNYTYAWTAISRPPYLTALALWPKGDCWDGGGSFVSNHEIWLNHPQGHATPHKDHKPKGLSISHNLTGLGEDDPILHRHLERDGWRHLQEWKGELITSSFQRAYQQKLRAGLPITMDWMIEQVGQEEQGAASGYITHAPSIHEKPHSDRSLTLTMTMTLQEFRRQYNYSVVDSEGTNHFLSGAGWADWDQRGRLVFTRDGKRFALAAENIGSGEARELVDLNDHKPEPIEAPEWAKVWSMEQNNAA